MLKEFSHDDKLIPSKQPDLVTEKLVTLLFRNSIGDADFETRRRIAVLTGLSLMAALTLAFFGVLSCIQGTILHGLFDLAMAVFLLVNLYDARKRAKFQFNIILVSTVTSFFFVYLYTSGGHRQTAFVWYFTYPLLASFLLGSRKGLIASGVMSLPVLALIFFRPSHHYFASYQIDFEIRFLFAYLLICLFSFLIGRYAEENREETTKINENLELLVAERTEELKEEVKRHQQARRQLAVNEHRYRAMFEKTDDAIFLVDRTSGHYLDINPAAEKLTGKKKGELLSLKVRSVAYNSPQNHPLCTIDSHSSQEEGAVTYFRPDGSQRLARLNTIPLTQDLVMEIAHDVTDLKKAEDERHQLETRLNQAQKMESIGTLAGGIAHDFNNILAAVMGFSQLALIESEPGSEQQDNIQEVLTATKRARELVNQILTFSRQAEPVVQPIQVASIVKEVAKLLRSTVPASIDIKVVAKARNSTIMGDLTQIHQVLMNLCTNAVHAIDVGKGALTITLDEVSSTSYRLITPSGGHLQGNYLQMSVSDTGCGIPEDIRNRIFDPFFTSKVKGKGTGMGLSVVHGIVESHNGSINVTSTLNQGTTFDVYFPLLEAGDEQIDSFQPLKWKAGNEHVLIIDDEVQLVTLLRRMLERLGYTVSTMTDSIEAIDSFRANHERYDAVVTDLTMPKMTGDLLAVEIKKIQPDIPVILCTGYSEELSAEKAEELGIDLFLMKPVSNEDLAMALRTVLDTG